MEDLFADDAALGNGELAPVESQAQPVKGNARQPENVVQENNENTPPHQYFFYLWNCNYLGNSLLTYPKFVACKTFLLRALSNIYLFYFYLLL